jgi:hypothetical protein
MDGAEGSSFSERTLLAEITIEGYVPFEFCFVFRDSLMNWNPAEEGFTTYFIEDDSLYTACIEYIKWA